MMKHLNKLVEFLFFALAYVLVYSFLDDIAFGEIKPTGSVHMEEYILTLVLCFPLSYLLNYFLKKKKKNTP